MKRLLGLLACALALGNGAAAVAGDREEQPLALGNDAVSETTQKREVGLTAQNGLSFVGTVSYEFAGSSADLKAAQIQNSRASGVSGTLQVALWATTSLPVFGQTITHYDLASFALGPLSAGNSYFNVDSGAIAFTRPPVDGTYYLTLALLEYSGTQYFYFDLVTFSSTVSWPLVTCTPTSTNLCLSGSRFRASVNWQSPSQGTSGVGTAVSLSADTGYFWFFNSANVELVIKVLDGRAVNGHFWIFYGALSNVNYTITVTDSQTGASRTYVNQNGALASVADTLAF